jgi:hypothetical protein
MRDKCFKQSNYCPLKKPYSDTHHLFFPASDYQTETEKQFRDLEINKEQLCRCVHNALHRFEEPPKKPSEETMRRIIEGYNGTL